MRNIVQKYKANTEANKLAVTLDERGALSAPFFSQKLVCRGLAYDV